MRSGILTMRKTIKFVLALVVALVLMLCFRVLAFTVYTIDGQGLSPLFCQGDRVLINRWSYGLRVGGEGSPFGYGRIGRNAVNRGDLVAFENPQNPNEVLICRCKALPGDTIHHEGQALVVPGLKSCASADHYWMEAISQENALDSHFLGFIPEQYIIGRAIMVIYSHDPSESLFCGWRNDRLFMPL